MTYVNEETEKRKLGLVDIAMAIVMGVVTGFLVLTLAVPNAGETKVPDHRQVISSPQRDHQVGGTYQPDASRGVVFTGK